jgi:hypothetical protein
MGASGRVTRVVLVGLTASLFFLPAASSAHRSGCHRWHSCPSDRGTYVCGDLGYCSQCPDNQYCLLGKPRVKAQEEEAQGEKETERKPNPASPRGGIR